MESYLSLFLVRHQRADNWIDYKTVAAEYFPHRRHLELYDFKESFLHPELIAYVNASPEERHNHIEELAHDIFRIPIFTDDFISKLNEEIDNAEKLRNDFNRIFDFNLWNKVLKSIRRDAGKWKPNPPNNMNKYGFRLREMGFFNFIDDFYNSKYIRFLLSNLLKVYFLSNSKTYDKSNLRIGVEMKWISFILL